MEKVIRNNKVAVLVSKGFGAGWSSWNNNSSVLLFHPKLVEKVEQGRRDEINEEWIEDNFGLKDVYCGGACGLCIEWLEVGTPFSVNDYDGDESLVTPLSFNHTA